MLATVIFSWHAAVDLILALGLFMGMSFVYRKHCGLGVRRLNYELLDYGDVEFERKLQESLTNRLSSVTEQDSEDEI